MRVGSLFAGIGGFDLAAERAGMTVVWQSELDPHASRVLATHWPHVENLGDIHGITTPPAVDVLCGGFPCQDYSLAGNRAGLAGDRGALWWEMDRLIGELRPTWVVGENVPGILSSRGGADFETIIRSLTERGYGVAWAVLDAQYFGVAQRRRRVFIVGHSGGVPRPEILALGEGVFGHPEPRREARQGTSSGTPIGIGGGDLSPSITSSTGGLSAKQNQHALVYSEGSAENYRRVEATDAITEGASSKRLEQIVAYAYNPNSAHGVKAFAQNQRDEVRDLNDLAGSLAAEPGMKQQTYVIQDTIRASKEQNGSGYSDNDVAYTLDGQSRPGVAIARGGPSVRRLTPLECERLQGFPDGWTDIPGNSDTQRYRQLGNAVCVPVVEWIMRRIAVTG